MQLHCLILLAKVCERTTKPREWTNGLGLQSLLGKGLTHWGRVTHICVGELTIICSDNGLSPGRRQAIIWNNAGLLLIEPIGTNFSEISIGIQTFSFKKMHLNMSSAKWRPFWLGLNVLTQLPKSQHTLITLHCLWSNTARGIHQGHLAAKNSYPCWSRMVFLMHRLYVSSHSLVWIVR